LGVKVLRNPAIKLLERIRSDYCYWQLSV